MSFTSSYNPQSDPAERANRQVLEALRAAASSVCHYDAWDDALPHLCFGLNNHVSAATGFSPFEIAHGFPAHPPAALVICNPFLLFGQSQLREGPVFPTAFAVQWYLCGHPSSLNPKVHKALFWNQTETSLKLASLLLLNNSHFHMLSNSRILKPPNAPPHW